MERRYAVPAYSWLMASTTVGLAVALLMLVWQALRRSQRRGQAWARWAQDEYATLSFTFDVVSKRYDIAVC